MNENHNPALHRRQASSSGKTIAFLAAGGGSEVHARLTKGILEGIKDQDANLICFYEDNPEHLSLAHPWSAFNEPIAPDWFDGLILFTAASPEHFGPPIIESHPDYFRSISVVSVGLEIEGIPSLVSDPYSGMQNACLHLIHQHGCQRIALIRGPEEDRQATIRSRAYVETLTANGLPFDPALIPLPCEGLSATHASKAINSLITDRENQFDAVIITDDQLAVGALEVLQDHGFSIPDDVRVVVFDANLRLHPNYPTLTTIQEPFFELGNLAGQLISTQTESLLPSGKYGVPQKLAVRASCGCLVESAVRTPPDQPSLQQEKATSKHLKEFCQDFDSVSGSDDLWECISRELIAGGIRSGYIARYEDPQTPGEWAIMQVAFSDGNQLDLDRGNLRFPTTQVIPSHLLPTDRPFALVVEPLYVGEHQLGYMALEPALNDEVDYAIVRNSISQVIFKTVVEEQVKDFQKQGEEQERFLAELEQRTLRLQTAADVAQAIGSILDLDQLIQRVVDLVRERFNLYYAGLFLVNEPQHSAILRAGTGQAGSAMVASGWKLPVGGASMIGRCIASGKADIQLDIEKAPVHLRNPYLPETRSEMALPLIGRGTVIGALTIQSTQTAAFSVDDITILQTLASQIANAIENSRLFEQTQTALREIEATHQRYLLQAWSSYAHALSLKGVYQKDDRLQILGSQLLPEVDQAMHENSPVVTPGENDSNVYVIPIKLRDQPIGAWGIKTGRMIGEEDMKMVETITEQFALAAEALRLLDETQRRAARERLVTEITTRIRASNDPDSILQTALNELRQALNVERAQIVIPTTGQTSGINGGSEDS